APRFDLFTVVEQQILSAHVNLLPYAASRPGAALFPAMRAMAELDDPALLVERAIARLDRLAPQPFFLTVFFSATHTPYVGPEPYWRRFADARYRGPFRYLKQPLPQTAVLPPDDARQVQALYDGALAATDNAIARLLRRLDDDGLTRDTIVVLLGDHGENLYDVPGRGMGHGDHLWGSLGDHVPLVIVDPRRAPRDVRALVRDVDLAPTLAHLVGVAAPPGDRRADRLPYPDVWNATEAAADGDLSLQPRWEQALLDAKCRAVRTDRWKLVYQPAPDGAHWRLFDLAAEHPAETASLRRELEPWITADGRTTLRPDAPAP